MGQIGRNKRIAQTGPRAQQGPTNESPRGGLTGPGAQQGPTNEWAQQGPGSNRVQAIL